MTRGYSITASWKYIDSTYDAETREKIIGQLSPSVRAELGTYKDIEFYPVTHWSEVLRGIATIVGKTDEQAVKELRQCGTFIAHHATNTFLRLFMRVLTPSLFARKIPSLWSRDNTAGSFSVDLADVDSGKLLFKLSDVEGFAYCGPVSMGWISNAMQAMGRTTKSMTIENWSLANPSPKNVEIHLQLEN
jgi:hypothetical protein